MSQIGDNSIALHRASNYEGASEQLELVRMAGPSVTARLSFYQNALPHLHDCYTKMGASEAADSVSNELESMSKQNG